MTLLCSLYGYSEERCVQTKRAACARIGLSICVVVMLQTQAQAQIFYNSVLDARTKAALKHYETSKTAHLAYLDSRAAEIEEQQAILAAAATETVIAERDFTVATVLGEDERASAAGRLSGTVAGRINAIVPGVLILGSCTEKDCRNGSVQATADYENVRTILLTLDEPRSDGIRLPPSRIVAMEATLTKKLNGKQPTGGRPLPTQGWSLGWFCRNVFPTDTASQQRFLDDVLIRQESIPALEANLFAGLASTTCDEIAEYRLQSPRLSIANPETRRALSALGGWGDDAGDLAAGSPDEPTMPALELGRQILLVRMRAQALKTELQSAEAVARGLKKQRDELVKRSTTDKTADELRQTAGCIAKLLGDETSSECMPDASGATKEQLDTLFSVGAFMSELASAGPELQRIRQGEAFEVVQYLSDPKLRTTAETQCVAAPPGTPAPAALSDAQKSLVRLCLTDAVVRTVGVLERAAEIRDGVPGAIAGLAVQLADAEMKAASIRLRAAAVAERANSLDAQRRALLSEVKSLMEIREGDLRSAVKDPARLDRGVFHLAQSFGGARRAYQIEVVRYGFIGQREFAKRERVIAAGRYAISDALLETIGSSTEGGIKWEQVTGIVSALGLTAVGVTEASK